MDDVQADVATRPGTPYIEDALFSAAGMLMLTAASVIYPVMATGWEAISAEVEDWQSPRKVKAPPPFDWKNQAMKCFVFAVAFPLVVLFAGDQRKLRRTIGAMSV